MIKPIYTYGEPSLFKHSINVTLSDKMKEYMKPIIGDMFETMTNAGGSGLAAPQIGNNINVIVIDAEIADGVIFKGVFINPRILSYSGGTYTMTEGCLSLPGIRAQVNRPGSIELEYHDENFEYHKSLFNDYPARILQHEYDHLIGKLFIDHLDVLSKEKIILDLVNIKQKKVKTSYPIL